jgi:hypothetical protein
MMFARVIRSTPGSLETRSILRRVEDVLTPERGINKHNEYRIGPEKEMDGLEDGRSRRGEGAKKRTREYRRPSIEGNSRYTGS